MKENRSRRLLRLKRIKTTDKLKKIFYIFRPQEEFFKTLLRPILKSNNMTFFLIKIFEHKTG